MKNMTEIKGTDLVNNQRFNSLNNQESNSSDLINNVQVSEIIAAEGGETFNKYVEGLGLSGDPNLVVLSSMHHYYYDAEEMKNVKTVINMKELNKFKQIKSLLHSMFHILPSRSNFIGCFIDNEKQNGYALRNNLSESHSIRNSEDIENGIVSRIPFLNMIYSIMDSRVNKFLSKRNVTLLLDDHGFKVLNMTEINGLTYFRAQSLRAAIN